MDDVKDIDEWDVEGAVGLDDIERLKLHLREFQYVSELRSARFWELFLRLWCLLLSWSFESPLRTQLC